MRWGGARLRPRRRARGAMGGALLLAVAFAAGGAPPPLGAEPGAVELPLGGGERPAFTVGQAIDRALVANRGLRIERLALASERRLAETGWNRFLPSVSGSSSLSRSLPARVSDPYTVSAGAQASLSLSIATIREGRRAVLQYQQGQISYEESERLLRRNVRRAYYAILVQQAELRVKRDAVETAELRYRRSKADYEDGLASRYTKLSDQVAWQRHLPELAALEDDLRAAETEFALLLGFARDTRVELVDELSVELIELEADRLVAVYREVRPAVRAEQLRITEDELAVQLERDRNLPNLSLSYSISRTHSTPFSDPWLDDENWRTSGQVQLSLSLGLDRLVPSSAARVSVENRERRIAERELRLIDLREEAAEVVEQLVRRVQRTQEALGVRALTEETARLAYELAEQDYDEGLMDALELRNAALELEETRLAVLEEQLRLLNAYAELEYLLGDQGFGL